MVNLVIADPICVECRVKTRDENPEWKPDLMRRINFEGKIPKNKKAAMNFLRHFS